MAAIGLFSAEPGPAFLVTLSLANITSLRLCVSAFLGRSNRCNGTIGRIPRKIACPGHSAKCPMPILHGRPTPFGENRIMASPLSRVHSLEPHGTRAQQRSPRAHLRQFGRCAERAALIFLSPNLTITSSGPLERPYDSCSYDSCSKIVFYPGKTSWSWVRDPQRGSRGGSSSGGMNACPCSPSVLTVLAMRSAGATRNHGQGGGARLRQRPGCNRVLAHCGSRVCHRWWMVGRPAGVAAQSGVERSGGPGREWSVSGATGAVNEAEDEPRGGLWRHWDHRLMTVRRVSRASTLGRPEPTHRAAAATASMSVTSSGHRTPGPG